MLSRAIYSLAIVVGLVLGVAVDAVAQNLTISAGSPTGVTTTTSGNVVTFTGTGTGSPVVNAETIAAELNAGKSVVVVSSGDITVSASIEKTSGADATLTLKSNDQSGSPIVFNNGNIISKSNVLNLVAWTDPGASTSGTATIDLNGVSIETNGGHFWAGAGAAEIWNGIEGGSGFAYTYNENDSAILIFDSSIASGGGDVRIKGTAFHTAGGDVGQNNGIRIYGNSSISSSAGSITLDGLLRGRYYTGAGLSIGGDGADGDDITITATSGDIVLHAEDRGDGAGSLWGHGLLIRANANSVSKISTTSGSISLEGSTDTTQTNDGSGVQLQSSGNIQVVSQAGMITLTGTASSPASGSLINGIRLAASDDPDRIQIGFDGSNAYSGNIKLISDSILQREVNSGAGSLSLQTSGALTIEPKGTTFTHLRASGAPALTFDDDWDFGNSLGELTIGKSTNTLPIKLTHAVTAAGPIALYGGDLTVDADLTSTGTDAGILIKASGTITAQDNHSIQSNGGDLVLWSNSDNANGGNVLTGQNVILDSRQGAATTGGGDIHIGGGADTNSDGFPDDATAGTGNFTGGTAYGILFGNAAGSGVELLSGGGNITLIGGVDGNFNAAANSHGIGFFPGYTVNANAGNITFEGYANSGGASTIGIDLMTGGAPNSSSITTTGNLALNGVTTVTQGSDNLGVILNAGLTVNAGTVDITGSSDDVSVLSGAPITATGSVSVSGGALSINQPLTGSDISLTAAGNVTQDAAAALTANNLSLNGTGNFTLQNTSNDVNTIAGGTAGARLGAVKYFDADDVTIGTVNPTGIYSSDDVLIETATGNINLAEPVNTTSATNTTTGDTGAIVLNAGKSAGTGSFGGGNIIVSGNGSVLSNGINKLYSESDAASTGLTTLAGGQSNIRNLVDETTTTFSPVLASNTTYALYRSGPLGEGDLTIVASGGAPENSGWGYNNGVLVTTQATVNVNASDLVTKLGLGNLTIKANNITVDAPVSWNNTNALRVQAIKNIVVGADDELISAGGNISLLAGQSIGLSQSTSWANRSVVNANGGNIIIQAISGAFDVSRVVSLAFVEIKTNGAGTIAITGDGTKSTRASESSWGVSFDGVASQSLIQSEHGAINIVGVGGGVSSNSRGIVADGRDFQILSATGAIALRDQRPSTCASCGYGGLYLNPSTNDGTGIVFGSDGATVLSGASTESTSMLSIQTDRFSAEGGTSTVQTAGAMTLEPASATFEASQTFPQAVSLASDVSGLTLGKSGSTAGITVDAATTIAGPITLYGDDISIEAALEATSDRVTFVGAAADDIKGTVSNNAAGTITADELLIENIHSVQLNTGNVNVAKLAGQGGHRMLLRNTGPLEIGSVGVTSGLSASEFVVIETTTGDLTVTESVASTLSAGTSVTLNAGRDKGVGDDSGGDIVVSGNGVINIETDAIAKLYSGSPAKSPGLSDKAGEVLVFYDETDQPPASSFAAGTVHAVYRQTTADRLRLDPEPSTTAASGVALAQQPTVAIVDAFDNVIRTDDETKIAVSIFTGDNGTLQGADAQAVTEGQASYTDLGVLGPVGQAYRLRFTSPGLSAVTSDPVTLTAPGPLDLTASVLSADPVGNVTADGQSQSFLTATLTDTYGNPRANEAVVLALNESEGRALGSPSGQTNAIGQFTTPLTSTVTGVTTVKAYSNSADPDNEVDTVGVGFIADEPTQIELVSGDGQTGEVATALDNPLTVRVLDAFDNVVEGASVAFTGDGTTDPVKGVAVTDGQGIASVDWTLGEQAGEQALQATLAGSDPEQRVAFQATATAGPPGQWGFEIDTFKQLRTIPFDVAVVLQDSFGNATQAGADISVAIAATNTSAESNIAGATAGDLTFDGTTNPVAGTLVAGESKLTLTDAVYSGLSAPDVETPDIELKATAALGGDALTGTTTISARNIQLAVTASPDQIVADGAEQSLITSTLLDLNDNPVANQPVRFENTLGELLDADSLEVLDQPVVLTGDANGQAQVVFRSQQASSAKVLTTSRGADPFELMISLVEDIDPAAVAALTAEDRPSDPDFGLEVYQDAGIEEATEDNLPAYNSALANLSLDADGVEAMVLAYNTLLSQAQTGSVALTEAQYAQLGITLSSREAVLLMNSILSAQGIDALKDHSRLLEIARIVQSLLDRRAGETEVTTIGADDLVLIGLQGVNARNAGFIVGALSDPSTSSAALTLAQMQTLASEASEAFQALPIPTTHPWALWVLMGMLLGLGVSQTRRLRARP